ncbi:PepSY domain-containing protein [Streptomyces fungicidicus]|uniref:PepSY domain-containing protein n=1 Tax=Streptomyces fungicidicus TaxID=68203 RepID=UPI0036C7D296
MKRNIVIAVVTAAALVGGGTATALAVSGDDDRGASVARAEARAGDDDDRDDDRDDRNEDRDDRDDRGEDRSDDRSDDRGDDRDERAVSGDVTAAEALAAALKHTPGTAVAAELDDGAWEVDVLGDDDGRHSVRVDPGSGKVLGASADDEDDAREVRAALKGSSVTAGEAARAAAGKGVVTSVELDDDDRGWEAETRASGGGERDWRVDLGSGKVTADRDDSDDD